jgi:hypothetical protein
MNKTSKTKLAHIFGIKYFNLIGVATNSPVLYASMYEAISEAISPNFPKWMKYLEDLGCRVVPKNTKAKRGFVLVEDPCHFQNKIQIPEEFAHKTLVLGGLP